MTPARLALFCAVLTAAALTLSNHFAGAWWLAWLAPVPVLWLAFGEANPVMVLATALAAAGLGTAALALPYFGVVPEPTLAAAVALSAMGFSLCVMGARLAARTLVPLAGAPVFAALWTLWDFIAASGPDGVLVSPATSQAGSPILIQTAALFGAWTITFLLGAVAACLALAFRKRNALYVLPAAACSWPISPMAPCICSRARGRNGGSSLIDSDGLAEASAIDRRDIALGAVLAYAAEIRLKARGRRPCRAARTHRHVCGRPGAAPRSTICGRRPTAPAPRSLPDSKLPDGRGGHNIALIVPPTGRR